MYPGTRENQIYHYFAECAPIEKVIMSKHKKERKACGFCFIVFKTPRGAQLAKTYMHRSRLNRRMIKVDFDIGFEDGREFGRGDLGGQKRDDFNEDGTKKPVPIEEDKPEEDSGTNAGDGDGAWAAAEGDWNTGGEEKGGDQQSGEWNTAQSGDWDTGAQPEVDTKADQAPSW